MYEMPQSRERILGRDRYVQFNVRVPRRLAPRAERSWPTMRVRSRASTGGSATEIGEARGVLQGRRRPDHAPSPTSGPSRSSPRPGREHLVSGTESVALDPGGQLGRIRRRPIEARASARRRRRSWRSQRDEQETDGPGHQQPGSTGAGSVARRHRRVATSRGRSRPVRARRRPATRPRWPARPAERERGHDRPAEVAQRTAGAGSPRPDRRATPSARTSPRR